jgi:hypothetical protein
MLMRKTMLLFLLLTAFALIGKTWAQPRIFIDLNASTPQIDSVKLASTGTLTIGVFCKDVVNLDSYSFDIAFNPAVLSFQTAAEDNSFAGLTNILKKNGGQTLNVNLGLKKGCTDTININNTLQGSDSAKAPEGDGLLGLIQFNVKAALPCTLSLHNVLFLDYESTKDSLIPVSDGIISTGVSAHKPIGSTSCGKTTSSRVLFPFKSEHREDRVNKIFDMRGRRASISTPGTSSAAATPTIGIFKAH